jgi:hypothetical protein
VSEYEQTLRIGFLLATGRREGYIPATKDRSWCFMIIGLPWELQLNHLLLWLRFRELTLSSQANTRQYHGCFFPGHYLLTVHAFVDAQKRCSSKTIQWSLHTRTSRHVTCFFPWNIRQTKSTSAVTDTASVSLGQGQAGRKGMRCSDIRSGRLIVNWILCSWILEFRKCFITTINPLRSRIMSSW